MKLSLAIVGAADVASHAVFNGLLGDASTLPSTIQARRDRDRARRGGKLGDMPLLL